MKESQLEQLEFIRKLYRTFVQPSKNCPHRELLRYANDRETHSNTIYMCYHLFLVSSEE